MVHGCSYGFVWLLLEIWGSVFRGPDGVDPMGRVRGGSLIEDPPFSFLHFRALFLKTPEAVG